MHMGTLITSVFLVYIEMDTEWQKGCQNSDKVLVLGVEQLFYSPPAMLGTVKINEEGNNYPQIVRIGMFGVMLEYVEMKYISFS